MLAVVAAVVVLVLFFVAVVEKLHSKAAPVEGVAEEEEAERDWQQHSQQLPMVLSM